MDIQRALVVGVGQHSIPTLYKLRNQLTLRHEGDVPVIGTILIHNERELDITQLSPAIDIIAITKTNGQSSYEDALKSQEVRQQLQTRINDILKDRHIAELAQRNITVQTNAPIKLVLVGNLEESFAARNILDIAQTVYLILSRTDAAAAATHEAFAVLTLPAGANASQDEEVQKQARSTLLKLSSYLERASSTQIFIDPTARSIQRVFLLESVNAIAIRVDKSETLFWMVGDWLYYELTSDLVPSTGNGEPGNAFSTLGYASIFVPEPQMRQVLTSWFIQEAFQDYVLAAPGPKPDPNRERMPEADEITSYIQGIAVEWWRTGGLLEDNIAAKLTNIDQNKRPRLVSNRYGNRAFYQFEQLEKALANDYRQQIEKKLPEAEAQQHDIIDRVQKKALEHFDIVRRKVLDADYPDRMYAPVRTTIRVFEAMQHEMEERSSKEREDITKTEEQIARYDETIRRSRAVYWDAAKLFGHPRRLPMPGLFLMLGLFIAVLVVGYICLTLQELLDMPMVAVVLAGLTSLTACGCVAIGFLRAQQKKNHLISNYVQRLQLVVKQSEAMQRKRLYEELAQQLRDEYVQPLMRARNELNSQLDEPVDEQRSPYRRTTNRDRTIDAAMEKQIYGNPSYELEESIIQRDDINRWYIELFGRGESGVEEPLRAKLGEFFREEPLSERLKHENRHSFRADLEQWIQQDALRRLRTTSIWRYLGRHPEERRRDMVKRMVQRAHVYARVQKLSMNPELTGEKLQVCVAEQDIDRITPLLNGVDVNGRDPDTKITQNPLRIDTLAVLPPASLQDIDVVSYLTNVDEQTKELKLHDPLIDEDLSIHTIVALARAVDIIHEENNIWVYERPDVLRQFLDNETSAVETLPLGESYQGTVAALSDVRRNNDFGFVLGQLRDYLHKIHDGDVMQNARNLGHAIQTRMEQSERIEKDSLKQYLDKLVGKFMARVEPGSAPSER